MGRGTPEFNYDSPEQVNRCLSCTNKDCNGFCNYVRASKAPLTSHLRASTIYIYRGHEYTVNDLAEMAGVVPKTMRYRLRKFDGDVEKAMNNIRKYEKGDE